MGQHWRIVDPSMVDRTGEGRYAGRGRKGYAMTELASKSLKSKPAMSTSPASNSLIATIRSAPAAAAGCVVAAGSLFVVSGAMFFQYVLLVAPCPLCLEQRKFHYAAIVLAFATAIAALRRAPRRLVVLGLAVIALVLLAGAGVAIYHSGVEWKLWAGPQDCSGPISAFGQAGSLLQQMQETSVVRCDEASFRFLGLSLAGYNALISLALVAVATWGALAERARG
jgi:disulfide bond formation protein DsbB